MSRVAGAAQDGLPPVGAEGEVLQVVGGEWTPAAAPAGDLSTATGTLGLDHGGTGATTAAGARQALLPTANTGKALVSDGSDASFTALAIDAGTTGTLPAGRGGTGLSSSGASGNVLRSNGTLWTSTQLSLSETTGTLPLNRGGTGATTQAAAANAILPAQASNGNKLLFTDGANASWSQVPLASSVSGQLPTANGGTGLSSSGVAGRVLRSDGSVWQSAQLAFADLSGTSGVALLDSPIFVNNPRAPTLADAANSSTTLATSGFVQAAIVRSLDAARVIEFVEDWSAGVVASDKNWSTSLNGAAAAITPNPNLIAGAWGYININSGTSNATGRAAISFEQLAGQLPWYQPWAAGSSIFEWRFQLSHVPVLTTADFDVWLGIGAGAATAGVTATDGVGLYASGSSANWRLVSRTASVNVSNIDTSIPVTANAWWYARIEVDGVSARLYLGANKSAATLVATILVASLTTVARLGPLAKIRNIAGTLTGGRQIRADYHRTRIELTTTR